MSRAARARSDDPLPLGTAMLSNIALSLLMWYIIFRVAGMLLVARASVL